MNMNTDDLLTGVVDELLVAEPVIVTPDDLVPGPDRPLRVGYDDILIQHHAQDNMLKLDEEGDERDKIKKFYVVCLEYPIFPLSTGDGIIPQMEFHPISLIYSDCMKSTIKMFEDEYGKRLWLPYDKNNRFEKQLGIPRITADRSIKRARIHRIRKDCVFGELR